MKKRIVLAAIICLSVWLIFAGAAYGATVFSKSLNASVKILPKGDFSYYSDPAATQQITGITLPDVTPGGTSTFTVYVKNTSSAAEVITAGTNSVPAATGTLALTFDGQNQKTLAANAVSKVVGVLTAPSTATAGVINFTFAVNATPAAAGTATATTTTSGSTATTSTVATVSYSSTIQPIFNQYCISCHGRAGGVNLTTYLGAISAVVPGNAVGSRLYQSVTTGSMTGYGMSVAQIQSLANWINQGAPNN